MTFSGKFLAIGAIVLLILVVVAVFIPRVRRMIAPHLSEARDSARVLREPVKLLQLFGGNFAAQLMLAVVLGLCLRAFGEQRDAGRAARLVNTMTSLFSGVMPVPGGIGVTEAAMTTLLDRRRHPGVAGGRRDARLPDHHLLPAPVVGRDLDAIPQTSRRTVIDPGDRTGSRTPADAGEE